MEYLHFDPVTLAVVILAAIGGWYKVSNSSDWHTDWIKKHERNCDDYKRAQSQILTELQVSNARLAEISLHSTQRLDRLEDRMDKER